MPPRPKGKARQPAIKAAGYRPLTKDELRKLGLSDRSRAFTSQKAGVKKLDPAKVISRRQADKIAIGRSNEALAKLNRSLGRSKPLPSRYVWARSQYLAYENLKRNARGLPSLTVGDIRSDKEWRSIYRGLKSKNKKPSGALAKALVKLGLRDASWSHKVGDTPKLRERGLL